jgi:hypothetical protein
MRLRFSTRSLLSAVIFLALACYFAFVRPTVLAQQFLDAVKVRDFHQAESLCGDSNETYFTDCMQKSESYNVADAKLFPRRRSDFVQVATAAVCDARPDETAGRIDIRCWYPRRYRRDGERY